MSLFVSINENNDITGVFDPEVYVEPNVDIYPITNDEFELNKNCQNFAYWQYINGKVVQSNNYAEIKKQEFNNQQAEARQKDYIKYSDPIFMQYQRGTATKEEWETKVAEIKTWHPYQI